MKALNRDALLQKEELQIERVDLDKGAFVFVRQMTGRERDRFDQSLMQEVKDRSGNKTYERNLSDFRAKLAVSTLCDDKGVNLLTHEDIATLSQNMSAARLEKIVTKAQELNKITEEDKENLVKNSEGDPVADSISDSA